MKNKFWLRMFPLGMVLLLLVCNLSGVRGESPPKNIILFIGDGMGLSTITAAKIVKGSLIVERFPHVGLVTTFAANDALITDSAAAATALATGYKTTNAQISVRYAATDGDHAKLDTLKTVLEWAEENGLSTGLIVTSSITHATPACFAAHVLWRSYENEIARQLAAKDIEVLLGGGEQFFLPKSDSTSAREDDLNLIEKFKYKGYKFVSSEDELQQVDPKKTGRLLGLFSDAGMPDIPERKPTLPEMTRKGLAILQNNKAGFFLMVEGSQIDWKAHSNDAPGMIDETLEFNQAIAVGLEFAQKHAQTLILVTADHETGGCAIIGGSLANNKVKIGFATGSHTAVMVPVFATGPGSDVFGGIMDNTFIGQKLIQYVQQRPQK